MWQPDSICPQFSWTNLSSSPCTSVYLFGVEIPVQSFTELCCLCTSANKKKISILFISSINCFFFAILTQFLYFSSGQCGWTNVIYTNMLQHLNTAFQNRLFHFLSAPAVNSFRNNPSMLSYTQNSLPEKQCLNVFAKEF